MGFFNKLLPVLIGVAAGFLFGPGAFSATAFAIGSTIGGLLFGPKAGGGEVKALDLELQKTEYGEFLPILYGTVRAAGIVIDTGAEGGVEKRKRIRKVKTGLFSKTKVTEYEYYLSCALMFGEGVMNAEGDGQLIVDKLLYGDDCIYDRSGADNPKKGYALVAGAGSSESSGAGENTLALYRGTWSQPVDPICAGWHAGKAPAYRGQAYARLGQLPLKEYDNELRPVTAILRRVDRNGTTLNSIKRICELHMERGGMPSEKIALSAIGGTVQGAFQTQRGGAKDLVERLAAWVFCDLIELSGQIRDASRSAPFQFTIQRSELNARLTTPDGTDGGDDESGTNYDADSELPSALSVSFQDSNNNYTSNTATSVRQTATHEKHEQLEMPIVAPLNEVMRWSQIALNELWEGRHGAQEALPPSRLQVAPGDVLQIPDEDDQTQIRDWRVQSQTMTPGGPLGVVAKSWAAHVYDRPLAPLPPPRPPIEVRPITVPVEFIAETVALTDEMADAPGLLIALTSPVGSRFVGGRFESPARIAGPIQRGLGEIEIGSRAVIGTTQQSFPLGNTTNFDPSRTLRVQMVGGELPSTDEAGARAGACRMLIGERAIRYTTATLINPGAGIWEISNILDGDCGSDYTGTLPVATPCVLLTDSEGRGQDGVLWNDAPLNLLNIPSNYRILSSSPAVAPGATKPVTLRGVGLKPLSPVRTLGARDANGNWTLSWSARTRYAESASLFWTTGAGPRMSDPLTFDIVLNGPGSEAARTKRVEGATNTTFGAAQLTALFGSVPGAISGTIYQVNASVGRGHPRTFSNL